MRKLILFFIFAFLLYMPALAQEDREIGEIQKVIEKFEQGFAGRDLDSMMSQISENYLAKDEKGNPVDYAQKKSLLEQRINSFFKKYVDYSFSELKIIDSEIKDNKATVLVKYKWKAFDLDSVKEVSRTQRKRFSLVKENDTWKITKVKRFRGKKISIK